MIDLTKYRNATIEAKNHLDYVDLIIKGSLPAKPGDPVLSTSEVIARIPKELRIRII